MTINLEPAYEPMVRREATSAAVVPTQVQGSGGAAINAAAAVTPPTQAERSPSSHSEQDRKRRPADGQDQPSTPAQVRSGTYENRLVYVNEVNRQFLDVVNRDNDELLMRIPPETLTKFLKDAQAPVPSIADDQTAPALDTFA